MIEAIVFDPSGQIVATVWLRVAPAAGSRLWLEGDGGEKQGFTIMGVVHACHAGWAPHMTMGSEPPHRLRLHVEPMPFFDTSNPKDELVR